MVRQTIVAGNWKMHGSSSSIVSLIAEIKDGISHAGQTQLVVFPPFVYLQQLAEALKGTAIKWGGQNVCAKAEGAYTGEVSASMLADFQCEYVLVGHSERRQLYGESNETVAEKFLQAKVHHIIPILCVGETQQQREANQTASVISEQIAAVLNREGGVNLFNNAVIAYEPVWAIGTGLTATPEQAQQVHQAIRQQIAEYDSTIAEALPILYGGSVKPANAGELFAMSDIDGGLVGGASLNAQDFLNIARV